ncbi:MAG: hypothetical protein NC402_05740 [Prevotella sp.]|nr:hypothetical protein [Prevotella sp.]MCM1074588.1 hypothetical protein [Ruminococcus sp.]
MRKIYNLAAAAMILVPCAATADILPKQIEGAASLKKVESTNVRRTVQDIRNHENSQDVRENEESEFGTPIYNAPEGTVIRLSQSGEAYKLEWQVPAKTTYEGAAAELVIANDGSYYLKNPTSQWTTKTYIKGTKVGNTIEFQLPVNVFEASKEYGMGGDYILTLLQKNSKGSTFTSYVPANTDLAKEAGLPAIENKLVIHINEDGTYTFNPEKDDSVIYGLMNSQTLKWLAPAEISCTWTPFEEEGVVPPTDMAVEQMAYTYVNEDNENKGHYVNVGFYNDNKEVYIQGLFPSLPDAWVKGTYEAQGDYDTYFVPAGQYLGYDDYNFTYTYLYSAVDDELGGYAPSDGLLFIYNRNAGTLTAPKQAILYAPGAEHYFVAYFKPVITSLGADVDLTPADPYDLKCEKDRAGALYFQFTVPNVNVDGKLLDTKSLYYVMYVDGEPYIFTPDSYIKLGQEVGYIPYNFTEGYDFISYGDQRQIYLYFEPEGKKLGVQLFNIKDGDIKASSKLVEMNVSGIDEVASDKEIAGVKYYNLNGCQVEAPGFGVFVKVITYTDGTTATLKVVK